jgi:uncharacterized protein YggE
MENRKTFVLMLVTLALVAVTAVFTAVNMAAGGSRTPPAMAQGTGETAPAGDVVAVYGQGRITIKPDIAYITLGVENTKPDPKEAQDNNSAAMEKVTAALKKAGIADADIQTAEYNVYHETSGGKPQGFRVTNLVQVTVKQIEKAGGIVKAAYDAGANTFSGVRFDIIERQKAYLEAADLAYQRAYEKADFLAKKAGKRLAGVAEMEEANANSTTPYYSAYVNYSPGESALNAQADFAAGTVSSGELVITALVNVKYRLE